MKKSEKVPSQDLATVFAVAATRVDKWSDLHALSRAWATAAAQGLEAERLQADVSRSFASIVRLEYCWAYPGSRLLKAISDAIAQRDA
ncbi:MAG TPA: hypothetical protein VN416_04115, partial [Desulfomonilia bacterium]|nr:hypothetical protein [Desulfomonilia bacterium]